MADGFTILPEFGNSQGANTAVLPDNNQVLNTYFQIQENKYRDKLFNYKKTQDEIAQKAQALNFDTGEVWQQDQPVITKKIQDLISFTRSNPDAYNASSDKYGEYDQKAREINFLINKSKHDKAIYDEWLNKGATDPIFQEDFESIKGGLDNFKATDINERDYVPPVPAPSYNLYEAWGKVAKDLPTFIETTEGENKGGNNYEYITTNTYDPVQRKAALEALYDGNVMRTRNHYVKEWNDLPQDAPERKQFKDAREYGLFIMDKGLPTYKDQSSAIKPRKFAPTGGGGSASDNEMIRFIAEKANALQNPNSDIYTSATVTTKDGTKKKVFETETFSGRNVVVTDKNGQQYNTPIDKIYNIDGKLYAAPSIKRSKSGSIAISDMIPITNIEDQIIVPYVNTEYGSSPNTAKLADNTLNYYRSIQGTSTQPKTESGGKNQEQRYDATIEAGIKAVMDKNPNATREQVIEALKKSGKIK